MKGVALTLLAALLGCACGLLTAVTWMGLGAVAFGSVIRELPRGLETPALYAVMLLPVPLGLLWAARTERRSERKSSRAARAFLGGAFFAFCAFACGRLWIVTAENEKEDMITDEWSVDGAYLRRFPIPGDYDWLIVGRDGNLYGVTHDEDDYPTAHRIEVSREA